MWSSNRRFEKVVTTVAAGLLIVASMLLVLRGPTSDSTRVQGGTPDRNDAPEPPIAARIDSENPVDAMKVTNSEFPSPAMPSSSLQMSKDLMIPPMTIRKLPLSDIEIERAWKQAGSSACELLPPDEPFEISRSTAFLTETDRRTTDRRRLIPAIRQHVLSVGLKMSRQGEQGLPILGRHSISDYIDRHYVSIQARVQYDLNSGLIYLHHRPIAATMQFTGAQLTQEFTGTVAESMYDFRGIGLWLHPGEKMIAENLRTLVLIHRYVKKQSDASQPEVRSNYELMFIRARVRSKSIEKSDQIAKSGDARKTKGDIPAGLELHSFVTTAGRQQLHYVSPDGNLERTRECGVGAVIEFTAFSHNAYPTKSVVVDTRIRSGGHYGKQKLNGFAAEKQWSDGYFEHLSELLDAILDGELMSDD